MTQKVSMGINIFWTLSAYPIDNISFLRRSKRPPLEILQYLFNVLNDITRTVRRIRADEDGSLSKSYDFNFLIVSNNIQLETTGGSASKLNHIIKRLNKEYHAKTRIGLGTQSTLPKKHYFLQGNMLHSSSVVLGTRD